MIKESQNKCILDIIGKESYLWKENMVVLYVVECFKGKV